MITSIGANPYFFFKKKDIRNILFVFWIQSNGGGKGVLSTLNGRNAIYNKRYAMVQIITDQTGGYWELAQPGINMRPQGTYDFGFYLTFAFYAVEYSNDTVNLIVSTYDGSGFAIKGAPDWNIASSGDLYDLTFYDDDADLSYVEYALSTRSIDSIVCIGVGGEENAQNGDTASFGKDVCDVMDDFEANMTIPVNWIFFKLKLTSGEVYAPIQNIQSINTTYDSIADARSNVDLFDPEHLFFDESGLHFDDLSLLLGGKQLFNFVITEIF